MGEPAAIMIFVVAIIGIGAGIMFEFIKIEQSKKVPVPLLDIRKNVNLNDAYGWNISIVRRSGYEESSWTISGNKFAAVDFAITKLQRARITTVEIVTNSPQTLEVRAFYESAGYRRTGKYIGGFVITSKS